MLTRFHVAGYRSLFDVTLGLGQTTVVVGPNGSGKSNLYRSLRLLQHAAEGSFARALADEGGMPSVLWAGRRRQLGAHKKPVRMTFTVEMDGFEYMLSVGYPSLNELPKPFYTDPVIKEETLKKGTGKTALTLMERDGSTVSARDEDGIRQRFTLALRASESALTALRAGHRFPHLFALRESLQDWRFYHQFRTDSDSPIRSEQVGVFTPVLSHDGRDLAAAIETIREIGHQEDFYAAIESAFPGASLEIERTGIRYSVAMNVPGIARPLAAAEMSDGTLRYLCLLAALLSPRPPQLLALNEPETSLHPDLLPSLAQLIAKASERSQLWVTTHSPVLAESIAAATKTTLVRLEVRDGETIVGPE